MNNETVNAFRKRRGRILASRIRKITSALGRPIRIIDVGGRRDYWDNVGFEGISQITLINIDPDEIGRKTDRGDLFEDRVGDARSLSDVEDNAFDFYHANSVIEHVGTWEDMKAMAAEARRVAKSGWVQTPAWEFPIEPHFRLPFVHWLATPARTSLIRLAPSYRKLDHDRRRAHAERINLLTKGEMQFLFQGCDIYVERFVLAKSYTAHW